MPCLICDENPLPHHLLSNFYVCSRTPPGVKPLRLAVVFESSVNMMDLNKHQKFGKATKLICLVKFKMMMVMEMMNEFMLHTEAHQFFMNKQK
jgi:hypothetical protein